MFPEWTCWLTNFCRVYGQLQTDSESWGNHTLYNCFVIVCFATHVASFNNSKVQCVIRFICKGLDPSPSSSKAKIQLIFFRNKAGRDTKTKTSRWLHKSVARICWCHAQETLGSVSYMTHCSWIPQWPKKLLADRLFPSLRHSWGMDCLLTFVQPHPLKFSNLHSKFTILDSDISADCVCRF